MKTKNIIAIAAAVGSIKSYRDSVRQEGFAASTSRVVALGLGITSILILTSNAS